MNSTTEVAVIQVSGDDALRSEDVLRAFERELSAVDQVAVRLEYGAGAEPVVGAKGWSTRAAGGRRIRVAGGCPVTRRENQGSVAADRGMRRFG